jgi:hypothetical protein
MVSRTIEYFAIKKDGDGHSPSIDTEVFDTFDEARAHIDDLDENGRYKYCACWTDHQGCSIERNYIDPTMKTFRRTDTWGYEDERLTYHQEWDKEHLYHGKVW